MGTGFLMLNSQPRRSAQMSAILSCLLGPLILLDGGG